LQCTVLVELIFNQTAKLTTEYYYQLLLICLVYFGHPANIKSLRVNNDNKNKPSLQKNN